MRSHLSRLQPAAMADHVFWNSNEESKTPHAQHEAFRPERRFVNKSQLDLPES